MATIWEMFKFAINPIAQAEVFQQSFVTNEAFLRGEPLPSLPGSNPQTAPMLTAIVMLGAVWLLSEAIKKR